MQPRSIGGGAGDVDDGNAKAEAAGGELFGAGGPDAGTKMPSRITSRLPEASCCSRRSVGGSDDGTVDDGHAGAEAAGGNDSNADIQRGGADDGRAAGGRVLGAVLRILGHFGVEGTDAGTQMPSRSTSV